MTEHCPHLRNPCAACEERTRELATLDELIRDRPATPPSDVVWTAHGLALIRAIHAAEDEARAR